MSFGENLQIIRKKNQLSQEGLAEMLGVSRQAVSKWECGEGYPEVEKLVILSKKLNISLDSLLIGENTTTISEEGKPSDTIRIISPHEGVIINAAKVTRSQRFTGGKNSPQYALFASDGKDMSYWEPRIHFSPGIEILKMLPEKSPKYRRLKSVEDGIDIWK